ncbi:MAG: hypothetical protein FRX49_01885 [Trebouxia sp. A1-2]|nr:MAG: hypothetical protein FRX49_01885 [Trebouxia sp. A1-2]
MQYLNGSGGDDLGACNTNRSHWRWKRSNRENSTRRNRKKRRQYLVGSRGDDVGAGEGGPTIHNGLKPGPISPQQRNKQNIRKKKQNIRYGKPYLVSDDGKNGGEGALLPHQLIGCQSPSPLPSLLIGADEGCEGGQNLKAACPVMTCWKQKDSTALFTRDHKSADNAKAVLPHLMVGLQGQLTLATLDAYIHEGCVGVDIALHATFTHFLSQLHSSDNCLLVYAH